MRAFTFPTMETFYFIFLPFIIYSRKRKPILLCLRNNAIIINSIHCSAVLNYAHGAGEVKEGMELTLKQIQFYYGLLEDRDIDAHITSPREVKQWSC